MTTGRFFQQLEASEKSRKSFGPINRIIAQTIKKGLTSDKPDSKLKLNKPKQSNH
jgi:hypothetical protein